MIKSFKHDGHLHRVWLENWRVPYDCLTRAHQDHDIQIFVNCQTRIRESDGREWISRIPGVSFFMPGKWYNVVALLEEDGIRYYCNVASPFYQSGNVLTYIDYDLDVILNQRGDIYLVDEDEYNRHKRLYHYSQAVEDKVMAGLEELMERIKCRQEPFDDAAVLAYYQLWKDSVPQDSP
jgi:protein associated with RNAse G/E